jgi:hypothetical protein
VFRGHDRPLAYRRPASSEDRTPAEPVRVEPDGHGGLAFRLCDTRKVPLYDPRRPRAQAPGQTTLPADERLLGTEAGPRVRGWLSVTGQSIGSKKSERLFVPEEGKPIEIGDRTSHERPGLSTGPRVRGDDVPEVVVGYVSA